MDSVTLALSFIASWKVISPLIVKLLVALILLLIGLLLARGLERITMVIMKVIQLDKAAEQTGFDGLLAKGGIKKDPSELLGALVYWVVALLVVVTVADALGLPMLMALTKVFAYMAVVFVAAFILAVGILLAGLIAGILRVIMANFDLEGSKTMPRVIYYIIIIFAFLAALGELGFAPNWGPHIGIIIGMPALAAAIAFGLGCKDMAADFLHNLFKGK